MGNDPGPRRRGERIGWVLLVLAGLPFVLFGVTAVLFGVSASDFPVGLPGGPDAVDSTTGVPWQEVVSGNATAMTLLRGVSRVAGLAFLGFGLLVITVAVVPYRRGERWAWYALWVVPVFMGGLVVHELGGDFVQMPALLLAASLAGLLLPYRAFFPRR
ncbi:MAG: hypothetical protein ACLGH4_06105 [Actinomycetes bacterium]